MKPIFKVWCLLLVGLALNLFTGASASASCQEPVFHPVFNSANSYKTPINTGVSGLKYLDSDSGRFWSKDKYEGTKYDPASLHRYLYTQADPVNGIDPSGEFSLGDVMTAIGIDEEMQATVNALVQRASQMALKKVGCNIAEAAAVEGVYVLVLGDGSFYVGQSNDIKRRFGEHLRDLEKAGARIVGMLKITTGIENARAAKYLREIFEALLIQELNPAGNTIRNPVAGPNRLLKYTDPVKAGMDQLFELTPLCHGTTH